MDVLLNIFCFDFKAKRTKKVGITGKYGTRYGASLRKMVKKMEITQHAKYTCSFCGKVIYQYIYFGVLVKKIFINFHDFYRSKPTSNDQRVFYKILLTILRLYKLNAGLELVLRCHFPLFGGFIIQLAYPNYRGGRPFS